MRCTAVTGAVLTKLIILVALSGMILGGGLFAWSRARTGPPDRHDDASAAEAPGEADPVPLQTVELGEFLVNLRSADGTLRYLQTEVSLVVIPVNPSETTRASSGHGGGHGEEQRDELELSLTSKRYARDAVVEALSSQSFERLRAQTDHTELKRLLRERVDEALQDYSVQDVLFTAFVMQ